ncbi:acryloyl-CoA reductase [Deinococcus pimensis]|uniref:acrylyl-CoA reductase (NADPH) n=1 Tax=Deinococcus pimensis TaxID=309888 RepID=UPI0004850681
MPDDTTLRALLLTRDGDHVQHDHVTLPVTDLPDGDVLVAVEYSSLNYKDGLAVLGRPGVVRTYPMVPGIDLVGEVVESESARWRRGDRVILTGWGVGERHWGGLATLARVRSDWLVALPDSLTSLRAMTLGTAGLTAMLCVMALEERGLVPGTGEVVVTGAAGGVGSVAVALLAGAGHAVTASTGRPEEEGYLRSLGASNVIHRDELTGLKRPLEKERWAGAVDTVGSTTLAGVLASLKRWGSVAACGLAGGSDLPATVLPFILRGVNLLGVDSVEVPIERRERAWTRLARDLPHDLLDAMVRVVPLGEVPAEAERILRGEVRGRTVVDVRA